MHRFSRFLLIAGSLSLLVAVQLGALGAHALESRLAPDQLDAWKWAVDMQFFHSLGLVLLALLNERFGNPALLRAAGVIMCAGLVLFCLSIYADSLGAEVLGPVAPYGGGSFMLAWLLTAIAAWRAN